MSFYAYFDFFFDFFCDLLVIQQGVVQPPYVKVQDLYYFDKTRFKKLKIYFAFKQVNLS